MNYLQAKIYIFKNKNQNVVNTRSSDPSAEMFGFFFSFLKYIFLALSIVHKKFLVYQHQRTNHPWLTLFLVTEDAKLPLWGWR